MSLAEQLQNTDLFHEVELADLEALISRMEQQTFLAGTVLFHAGEFGDSMYIIREGRIRIFIHDDQNNEVTLTHYGKSEIFGELSPIDQRPRSASAAAAEDLDVLVLDREHFLDFLDERPQIGLAMMRSLSQRLRNTTSYLEEYKPARFEAKPVDKGEMLRKAASSQIVEILDRVGEDRESKVIDVSAASEILGQRDDSSAESLSSEKRSLSKPGLFASVEGAESKQSSGLGIFEHIADVQEQNESSETTKENN